MPMAKSNSQFDKRSERFSDEMFVFLVQRPYGTQRHKNDMEINEINLRIVATV